jgi:hypothetical protein
MSFSTWCLLKKWLVGLQTCLQGGVDMLDWHTVGTLVVFRDFTFAFGYNFWLLGISISEFEN